MRYKQEFPTFDYEHPRLWVARCERFFILARISRDEMLNVLCVNLSGKVGVWFEGYLNRLRVGFQWADLQELCAKDFVKIMLMPWKIFQISSNGKMLWTLLISLRSIEGCFCKFTLT